MAEYATLRVHATSRKSVQQAAYQLTGNSGTNVTLSEALDALCRLAADNPKAAQDALRLVRADVSDLAGSESLEGPR
ncbi:MULTISPECIES: hypothetical protein [unclassified Streptomyces]|uniref:hypothetical protein n=1 Tax=unclassified Streptomyces TaxID=2593676 RepID=UPI003D8DA126